MLYNINKMNPQDQNTYIGPPPRAVDHNIPQDPYLQAQYNQAYQTPYADQSQAPYPYDPNQAYAPGYDPNLAQVPADQQAQLISQIQMAQQAGIQAQQVAQSQTMSAQMLAQPTPAVQPAPGTAEQVYKSPLVISNSVARAFAYLAITTIIISVISFIVNQLSSEFKDSSIYATVVAIVGRINTVTLFARFACVGFAVVATIIRIYNSHPYNTKNAITGWIFAILSLLAPIIFH